MPFTDGICPPPTEPALFSTEEKRTLLAKLDAIEGMLRISVGIDPGQAIPADAAEAGLARRSGHLRGWFTVEEFAAITGMHPRTVSDKCACRVIHTLRHGAARHRIPLSEETRWNQISKPGAIG